MIAAIVLYAVLGLTGVYGIKKSADTYLHLDDNDTKRYDSCVKSAEGVRECKNLE